MIECMKVEKSTLGNVYVCFGPVQKLMKMNCFDDFDAPNGFKMRSCVGIQVFMIFRCLYMNWEFLEVKV